MIKMLLVFLLFVVYACGPPPADNIYRKEGRFPSGLNVPVAFLTNEWAGKPRILASGWLIDGGNGTLFSAKHFTDTFMNDIIELGANQCKVFLSGRVYTCVVVQVPPLRDAVILKIFEPFNSAELLTPYKIATTKLRIGDAVFIQGFHPHPSEITTSNATEGFKDLILPIFRTFYELREDDPARQREVVFDNLEAVVVDVDVHINTDENESSPEKELKFRTNEYIKVITKRNHKFSFGGLSGGVVIKVNKNGEKEAFGIITAERPERLEYDKRDQLISKKALIIVSDTILVTPIYTVNDLYEYARTVR